MQYLYHRIPENMEGSILYPLNQLKEKHPDAHSKAVEKYAGRELLLDRKVPKLNCLWNDVLHLSSVNPIEVKQELGKHGRQMTLRRFYKIDPFLLEPEKTVVYVYKLPTPGGVIPDADIVEYDPAKVGDYGVLSEETKQYYAETIAKGGSPLLWHLVPHVLYKGQLDVSKTGIVEL